MPRSKVFPTTMVFLSIVAVLLSGCKDRQEQVIDFAWKPVPGKIMTPWAGEVSPASAHAEYPRPQMVRSQWMNLNGIWEYAVRPKDAEAPEQFDGGILVPYPVESALSGVGKAVQPDERVWYRRTFRLPKEWRGRKLLLNFEAVDWETTVWVNGRRMGMHRGGYDPFSFEISGALKRRGDQEILISVWDPTDTGTQPRGKQVLKPRGIWYTAVTGIWRTVWLEPVEEIHIQSLRITPDVDAKEIRVRALCSRDAGPYGVVVEAGEGGTFGLKAGGALGQEVRLSLDSPRLWSPDDPHLYDLRVKLEDGSGRELDAVTSYFGMRKIAVEKDDSGVNRLFLNGAPLFQIGPLDQGWWPDGLYTAPADAALRYDVEITRELGFNMLRKHVKIEPRRFYYWCDKLGVMVWQDMPSGDEYIGREGVDIERSPESEAQFMQELRAMIDTLFNHPSIVMWVAFNEGWGQFKTEFIADYIADCDATRLVDNASGWADRGVGDVHDIHRYPGPAAPENEPHRAAVLGEFGGLGLPLAGHTWQDEENWGYRSFKTAEELTAAYLDLLTKLKSLVTGGLAAAVYTQTSDVEIEVNGLMTYDRAVIKMDKDAVSQANRALIR